jgi:predicted permease
VSDRRERNLESEIEFHLEQHVRDLMNSGMSQEQAWRTARKSFGNITRVKEDTRHEWGWMWFQSLVQDLRYACRMLRNNPVFAFVTLLSLTVGIGTNTAIVSVLNAVMLRPLPVRNADELFVIEPQDPETRSRFSYPAFEQLRQVMPQSTDLAAMSRIARMYGFVDGKRESQTLGVQLVSGEYFAVLGVSPVLGRMLTPSDNQTPGAHPVAVISNTFWLDAFGGATDVVGRELVINGTHFTVVGVSEPGFSGVWLESSVNVWVPLAMQADVRYARNFSNDGADGNKPWLPQENIRWLDVIGRRTSSNAAQVAAALTTRYEQILAREAESIGDPARHERVLKQRLILGPFGQGFSSLRDQFASPLFVLAGMAMLMLLIACTNIMNLLLARATARHREIAVRLSIGASRRRLIRQLLTESFLFVAVAAVAGLLFAKWSGSLLVRMAAGGTNATPLTVDLDGRVLAFTLMVSAFTGLLFCLAPAVRISNQSNLQLALTLRLSFVRGVTIRPRLQKFLVVSQVGLSLVLLVGAFLFVRSLHNYERIELGFEQERVLSVWINTHAAGHPASRLPELYRNLVERVEAIPGVSSASLANCGLANSCQNISGITIEGYQPLASETPQVQENRVGPKYFATTGMRLVEGRDFDSRDNEKAPQVAIVNRAMVRRFFPNNDAIGKHFGYGRTNIEIVGVVEDARVNRVQQSPVPMAFYPMAQGVADVYSLEVRAGGDPRSLIDEVRHAVSDVDAKVPIDRVTILAEQVASGLNQERLVAQLTSVFGGLALGLACFGLYGVMSYTVERRKAEFGIRMALGARHTRVMWMILRESLLLIGAGLLVGIIIALAAARLVPPLLFGVTANDPTALLFATVVLVVVAACAACIPAWRASRIDPIAALQSE